MEIIATIHHTSPISLPIKAEKDAFQPSNHDKNLSFLFNASVFSPTRMYKNTQSLIEADYFVKTLGSIRIKS